MSSVIYPCLKNRRVLISGGASGIGAAFVRRFVAQGALVSFIDRDEQSGQQLLAQLQNTDVQFYCGDVRERRVINDWIGACLQNWQGVDVLVNNVANDDRHSLTTIDEDYLDNNLAINFKSHVYAIQSVIDAMKAQNNGCIINVSSNCFLLGLSGYPLYASAKAAMQGLTRSLAREYGAFGIRVNALIPGWVMTERQLRDWVTPEALTDLKTQQSLKDCLTPDDIADAALFLASSQARMISAQNLIVDGGRV